MPVELNTSARYPCESAGCTQSFKSKADREEHYQDTHVASRITHGRLAALPASLPSASNWADLESLENDPLSSDSWGASSKATNVRNIVKCTYKDCSKVFSTEEDMISHKIDASEHD